MSKTISRMSGTLNSSTTQPDNGNLLNLLISSFSFPTYSRAPLGAVLAMRFLSSRRSVLAALLYLIRNLRIVVQELIENVVVIVKFTLLCLLETFRNRLEQCETINGIVDRAVLRHPLDHVHDFLFRHQVT